MNKTLLTIFSISFIFFIIFSAQIADAKTITCNTSNDCTGDNPTCDVDSTSEIGWLICNPGNIVGTPAGSNMPTLKNPLDTLQVPLPTGYMKKREIKCDPKDEKGNISNCRVPYLADYIAGWFKYLVGIGGILGVIVSMMGGFLWIISSGNPQKIATAKNFITNGMIGIILLMTSYVILYQVSPELTKLNDITVGYINKDVEDIKLSTSKSSGVASQFANMPCPTATEFSAGVEFYATGYYKPPHNDNSLDTLCKIAMQCDCTTWGSAKDTSGVNCNTLYGKTYPNYLPCKSFSVGINYCNKNSSGIEPEIGTIAADWSCLPQNQQICANGKTYTVKDKGSGIKGRRIDIWAGNSVAQANKSTGKVMLKKGPCN
jgi:3D (Asp-Asp-Asp) domain-containing protein